MLTTVFAFTIVLGILIFFHELGHFLTARLFGVGVEKFSLGFGPRLFGKKIGITDYLISAVPFGGYVKLVGDEPDADIDPDDIPISFTHKHVIKRILIVAAGPFFNLLLAVIIFFGIFQISGMYILEPFIGRVQEGKPAQLAGLQKDDRVVAVNGIAVNSWDEMKELISASKGGNLALSIQRSESEVMIQVTPKLATTKNIFNEDIERYIIGIVPSGDTYVKKLNPFQSFGQSIIQTYRVIELTIVSIIKLVQGKLPTNIIGGPIMIAEMAGQQAKAGAGNLVFFIALLSINLAILNFLPIPVLDGGHLLFFFIELVTGRSINTRMQEVAQQVGLFILILLMVFVSYNDIVRYFFSK